MKVNTRYSRISQQLAIYLATIRTLFSQPFRATDEHIITHNYSISDDVRYPELILNNRFGLAGDWKIVNPLDVFDIYTCREEFDKIYKKSSSSAQIALLWNDSKAQKAEVHGVNYNQGIKNLFKKITAEDKEFKYKESIPNKKKPITLTGKMPWVLIRKVNTGSYNAYLYFPPRDGDAHGTFKKLP